MQNSAAKLVIGTVMSISSSFQRFSPVLARLQCQTLFESVLGCAKRLHSGSVFCSSLSSLAFLRRQTGFALSQCKKALALNDGDIDKAKEWLQKEAEEHSWAKATKLADRPTVHGLIGLHIENNIGGLVEVNCETDFVAKNKEFQVFVVNVAKEFTRSLAIDDGVSVKNFVDKETMGAIKTDSGKLLSDTVAMTVGKFGENVQLSRGVFISSNPETQLVGYVHPSDRQHPVAFGKYGAVVILKNLDPADSLSRDLCLHIIGMKPSEIGSMEDVVVRSPLDISGEDQAEQESSSDKESSDKDDDDDEPVEATEREVKEETVLLKQMFVSDDDFTVGEVLKVKGIEILDFIRFELGETQKSPES